MCARTGTVPALECTVGDLQPGQWFHDPNGETWMVTSLLGDFQDAVVVNTGNGPTNPFGMQGDELKGRVTPYRADTKLGRDRDGRLYASTALNDWYLYRPAPNIAVIDGKRIDMNVEFDDIGLPGDDIGLPGDDSGICLGDPLPGSEPDLGGES